MIRRTPVRSIALALATAGLAGCSSLLESDGEPRVMRAPACEGPATPPPEAVVAPLRRPASASDPGSAYADVARAVPGFGGAFHEGDRLVLLLTEPQRGAGMKAAIRAAGYGDYEHATVRAARWDAAVLHDWKLYILNGGHADWRGATSYQLDVERNRLHFTMLDAEARASFAERLAEAGVPCDLVLLEVDGWAEPNGRAEAP